MNNTQRIGMVGLGLLGSALAERFLLNGYEVAGYDLDPSRRQALFERGGKAADSTANVVAGCGYLVFCLPTSTIVEAVLDDIDAALGDGLILIDTTTGDPERSAGIGARLAARGVSYLDATVLGSSEQARLADVLVMIGGESETVARCESLFACFARDWFHVGSWGSGARLKLVVNLVLGLNRAVLAEGLAFAQACGIDTAEALRVLRAGAAYSRVMDIKGRKMLQRDFKPQAKLGQHLKDVELILTQGQRVGARLPLSTVHRDLLLQLIEAGFDEEDNSAILKAFLK